MKAVQSPLCSCKSALVLRVYCVDFLGSFRRSPGTAGVQLGLELKCLSSSYSNGTCSV